MKKVLLFSLPLALMACTSKPQQPTPKPQPSPITRLGFVDYEKVNPDIYRIKNTPPEMIQNGRYTLVSSSPMGGQKYLLQQFVDLKLPLKRKFTVEQGLKQVLKGTGYTLCSGLSASRMQPLFSRSLPKVHYRFNTMALKDALQMLVGNPYRLVANDARREVCFVPRNDSMMTSQVVTSTSSLAKKTAKIPAQSFGQTSSKASEMVTTGRTQTITTTTTTATKPQHLPFVSPYFTAKPHIETTVKTIQTTSGAK